MTIITFAPVSSADKLRSVMMNRWAKGLGIAGFAFFFAKGLAWLLVPVMLYRGCVSG